MRELLKNARVLVDVRGRAMVFAEAEISPVDERKRGSPVRGDSSSACSGNARPSPKAVHVPSEIDLHGLTVEQALARAGAALSDSLLADVPGLRYIHGRSGGRVRDALHRWLGEFPTVRALRTDPRNEGVTIVTL